MATAVSTDLSQDVSPAIINQSLLTKKGLYSEIYDINSEDEYEGDINKTENKYLNILGKIHKILTGVVQGTIPSTSIESISEISQDNNEKVKELAVIIETNKTSANRENLISFINGYFFKYAWWLGNERVD